MFNWVTPSRAVAEEWVEEQVHPDADAAAQWILAGHDAIVLSDEVARQILTILGLSDLEIEDRMHYASTGRVLPARPPHPGED